MINQIGKGMLVNFFEILLISSFTTSSARFREFDAGNVVLFQIKVSGRNIKETMLTTLYKAYNTLIVKKYK